MSDPTFGLLTLPAPVVADGAAVTDPALDMLLAFCKAVLNADLATAWAAVAAADPVPVAYTFPHDPDLEDFDTNKLPALYMWRADDKGTLVRASQDLVTDEGGFHALWVPPPASFENRQARSGMRNGLKKSLTAAFGQGRHPAWVVAGDDYFQPEDYGSVLLHHIKFMKARFGQVAAHKLVIQNEGGRGDRAPFECLFFTIECQETLQRDGVPVTNASGYSNLSAQQSTMSVQPTATDDALPILDTHVEMTVTGIDVATGPETGHTDVTISGTQFIDGDVMIVLFGATPALVVTYVDESTLVAMSPPGTGVVDIVVSQITDGVQKTLPAAFTYTP